MARKGKRRHVTCAAYLSISAWPKNEREVSYSHWIANPKSCRYACICTPPAPNGRARNSKARVNLFVKAYQTCATNRTLLLIFRRRCNVSDLICFFCPNRRILPKVSVKPVKMATQQRPDWEVPLLVGGLLDPGRVWWQ